MKLPLPSSITIDIGSQPIGNTGLWFDKFFDCWNEDISAVPPEGKSRWIKRTAHAPVGATGALAEAQSRLEALVTARDGRLLYFKTGGRFVTGLGRAHPLENGFAWHHGLGTPYLAGPSIKGMIRAWAIQEAGAADADVQRILGNQAGKQASVGSVVFLDALPTAPVKLDADVMTPHYAPYYEDPTGQIPPADWHEPRPIPFLTVADGQSFAFGLLPRRPHDPADVNDCETASQWLVDALIWFGAGAKTAVGYGRFDTDAKATDDAAARINEQHDARERETAMQQRLHGLSPLAQQLERTIAKKGWDDDKNAFAQSGVIEAWLDKLETDMQADAVARFREIVSGHFPGLLEDPDKLQGKKRRPVFNDRQKQFAKRLLALVSKS